MTVHQRASIYSWSKRANLYFDSFTFKCRSRILNDDDDDDDETVQTKCVSESHEEKKNNINISFTLLDVRIKRRNEKLKTKSVPKLQREQYAVHVNYKSFLWSLLLRLCVCVCLRAYHRTESSL